VGIKAGILLSAVQSGAEHTFDWRIAKLSPLGDTPDLEGRRNNQVGDEPNPELLWVFAAFIKSSYPSPK